MCVNLLFRERYHLYQVVVCVGCVCVRARTCVCECVCASVCFAVIINVRRVVVCGPMDIVVCGPMVPWLRSKWIGTPKYIHVSERNTCVDIHVLEIHMHIDFYMCHTHVYRAEYCLFCRSLLQKRPVILSILLAKAPHKIHMYIELSRHTEIHVFFFFLAIYMCWRYLCVIYHLGVG